MKIIFVRHAEPFYDTDTLTDKGKREAALLAERARDWQITQAYVSPLGRAQDTALPTLKADGIRLECHYPTPAADVIKDPDPKVCLVYPWLREFSIPINSDMHPMNARVPWDYPPYYLSEHPELYDPKTWFSSSIYRSFSVHASTLDGVEAELTPEVRTIYGQYFKRDPRKTYIQQEYEWVCGRFDQVLAQWGYHRDGLHYRTRGNALPTDLNIKSDAHTVSRIEKQEAAMEAKGVEEPVLVFFCHLGIASILISHLINTTPAVMQQGFFLPTSSVTIFSSEERIPGQALFRCQVAGDTSHLRDGDELTSFYGSYSMPFQG